MKDPIQMVHERHRKDPQFIKEFQANPRSAYEKVTGQPWPLDDYNVQVVCDDAKTIHLVIPYISGEMNEENLMQIMGGYTSMLPTPGGLAAVQRRGRWASGANLSVACNSTYNGFGTTG